jgi:hypothetical protein
MSTHDDIARQIAQMEALPQAIATEAKARWDMRTPVDTGALLAANTVEVLANNDIQFSNALPYFDFVEDGTPKMRPVGMLKTTIGELTDIVRVALARTQP